MNSNYSKAKLFFVDFDDTFFIHENRMNTDYYARVLDDPETVYDGIAVPNEPLIKFLSDHSEVPVYCLTWASLSLAALPKETYFEKCLPGRKVETITTATPKDKIYAMQLISRKLHIDARDALLIDDLYSTNQMAREAGFMAITPQQIMNDEYKKLAGIT